MASENAYVWRRRAATTFGRVAVASEAAAGVATLAGSPHWSAIAAIVGAIAGAVAEAVAPSPDDPPPPDVD